MANGYTDVNGMFIRFGEVKTLNQLRDATTQHPLLQAHPFSRWEHITWAMNLDFQEANGYFMHGVAAASYVLGIDAGQTMEATFNSPLTATTKWSAPLNVAVTYN